MTRCIIHNQMLYVIYEYVYLWELSFICKKSMDYLWMYYIRKNMSYNPNQILTTHNLNQQVT